jgi:hypothetical protein
MIDNYAVNSGDKMHQKRNDFYWKMNIRVIYLNQQGGFLWKLQKSHLS